MRERWSKQTRVTYRLRAERIMPRGCAQIPDENEVSDWSFSPARVLDAIDPREAIRLLVTFVRTPSESGQEKAMADALVDALRNGGVRDVHTDDHHNVLAVMRGRDDGPRRLFLTHLDTSGPGKMTDPFEPRVLSGEAFGKSGEVLRGRGACAPKASLAALVAAASALARSSLPETGTTYIAAVSKDLHANHEGVRELLESFPLEVDWIIGGEPSRNRIVLGARGINHIRFSLSGVPAHWGRPDEAANPLYALADLLSALETLPLPKHPSLGSATLSPSDVSADATPPLSPHRAELRMDRRTLPGEASADVVRSFERVLADVLADRPRISGSVVLERAMHSFQTAGDDPLVLKVQNLASKTLGRQLETTYIAQATNVSYGIVERGWAGIALGPGDIRDVGDDEHVELAQVIDATRIYSLLMNA